MQPNKSKNIINKDINNSRLYYYLSSFSYFYFLTILALVYSATRSSLDTIGGWVVIGFLVSGGFLAIGLILLVSLAILILNTSVGVLTIHDLKPGRKRRIIMFNLLGIYLIAIAPILVV